MAIKKLVVVEFTIEEGEMVVEYEMGEIYSYFVDPETGKYYRPKTTFEVTGDNLEDLFEEVPVRDDKDG